jgi:nucleotide-binding universal stress UspA family protein
VGASAGTWVLVGVTTDQPAAVVTQAVMFAQHFGATLVCAHVASQYHVVEEHPDGSVESRPLDPDAPAWTSATFDPDLARRIFELASAADVAVELRELAGEVGHALGRLAEVLDAAMIIVGSRRGRFRTSMRDFLSGSVAVHLAHRQPRPVVVVPLDPQPQGQLPWEHGGR